MALGQLSFDELWARYGKVMEKVANSNVPLSDFTNEERDLFQNLVNKDLYKRTSKDQDNKVEFAA
jgi:hypothetical protein